MKKYGFFVKSLDKQAIRDIIKALNIKYYTVRTFIFERSAQNRMKKTNQNSDPCKPCEKDGEACSPRMEAMGLLLLVTRLHHSEVESHVEEQGLHHSQHRMLMTLAANDGIGSQRDLARILEISPAALTATVKALEKGGCISRQVDEKDNRRNFLFVTDKGREKVEESHRLFEEMDKATFEGFSDEEMETLIGMLRRMADNLRAVTGESETDGEPDGE